MTKHKYPIGSKVVYTNDFGVCWGVKTITEHSDIIYGESGVPTYFYEGTDTPWCPVSEKNLKLANGVDLIADQTSNDLYFQEIHGFKPTLEQLGGCY